MKMQKFDSINVVPFIDVILVLLVIVLTCATFVVKGLIPIDLSVSSSKEKIKKIKILDISISKNGFIYFNKEKIKKTNLSLNLQKYKNNTIININCDKNTKFDNFVFLLDILKNKNYNNISIVTKYE